MNDMEYMMFVSKLLEIADAAEPVVKRYEDWLATLKNPDGSPNILTRKILSELLERIGQKNSWGKNELIKMIAEVSCEVLD